MFYQGFHNREEAGNLLALRLREYDHANAIVLAIPRGGVPVGYEIARSLHIPLDIVLAKKIGHPFNKEFAIGSVSLDSLFLGEITDIPRKYIDSEIVRIRKDLKEKRHILLGDKAPASVAGKVVILVDDGIATGNTVLATIQMLRKNKPSKIIVATPVIPYSRIDRIKLDADKLIYLYAPIHFPGVGSFYENFEQVTDEEVIRLLKDAEKTEQIKNI